MVKICEKIGLVKDQKPYLFPDALRLARVRCGMLQHELALRSGLDQAVLCGFEKGRRIGPSPELVKVLGSALQLSGQESAELVRYARHDRGLKFLAKELAPAGVAMIGAALEAADLLSAQELTGLTSQVNALTLGKRSLMRLVQSTGEASMT